MAPTMITEAAVEPEEATMTARVEREEKKPVRQEAMREQKPNRPTMSSSAVRPRAMM